MILRSAYFLQTEIEAANKKNTMQQAFDQKRKLPWILAILRLSFNNSSEKFIKFESGLFIKGSTK